MDIQLHKDSVINERTGEVNAPNEYVENLRALEREVAHLDDQIDAIKADLKAARDGREEAVARLRQSIREGKVLPLFEAESDEADGDE